jgi:hypothetical protein
MFVELCRSAGCELVPKIISPSDLLLKPDPLNKGRNKLYCTVRQSDAKSSYTLPDSELDQVPETTLEEIHQIGLELHQSELFGLEKEMLCEISLRCMNDMRTILLVHDKRMLGIVKQELRSLTRRKVLTAVQASALDKGIVDTLLPGSTEIRELLGASRAAPDLKNQYLLKPIRSGKGAGIVFGDDVTPEEWAQSLESLQSAMFQPGPSYVIQRRVVPLLYDVMLGASEEQSRYPLVGTYHAVHGRFIGLGIWRSSGERICALSHGGSWICSVSL